MAERDLHEAAMELRRVNSALAQLKRKQALKQRLEPIGIGLLIYRHISKQLTSAENSRAAILKKFDLIIGQQFADLENRVNSIEKSGIILSKQQENELTLFLDNIRVDLSYLRSQNAFSEDNHNHAISEIDRYRNFVLSYNSNLYQKHAKEKLLATKSEIIKAQKEICRMFHGDRYFSKKELYDWTSKWQHLLPIIREAEKRAVIVEFSPIIQEVNQFLVDGQKRVECRNQDYVQKEIDRFDQFFGTLESYPLTVEQRKAIVVDEQSNLIVAGAGSGKTSTIVGKAGYLIQKGLACPEEILLVAFNRDVALEMDKRISQKLGKKLKVKTFHSLGLEIIADCRKEKPSVSELAADRAKLPQKILEFIEDRMENDKAFARQAREYFLFNFAPYKTIFEFNSHGEYIAYLRNFEIRSLKGDLVKSFEECDIANFLFLNGIDYEYEEPYEVKTADANHRQYKPDFYLTRYKIYLEHFGIDRNGNTAPYISAKEYRESMAWKRQLHASNGTTLVETFSFEKQEGTLLGNLERKLAEKGVVFQPIPNDQIFQRLNELGKVNPFAQLLCTFLNLYKSSEKTIDQLQNSIDENDNRAKLFLEIFRDILNDYNNYLSERQEIDFNDMIAQATDLVKQQQYNSNFKYILVDEFQDISHSRSNLLKALLDQNGSKLFAVGDDWQSIYRFTGSDISIMLDFENIYGFSQTSFLEETFRFNQNLCDFSCKFILQNANQIKKHVKSKKESSGPVVSIIRNQSEDTLNQIIKTIDMAKKGKESVFIIGRYNFLEPENLKRINRSYPDLTIGYTTAHSSKGLEADYVIIIGLTAGQYGFPSEITDDPLLNLVVAKREDFPNAEERRLFYVAITRAKKHVYILMGGEERPSEFLTEVLRGDYELENDLPIEKGLRCPRCKTGKIVERSGRYGAFYSCSNYPYCEFTPKPCPKCQSGYLLRDEAAYKCSNIDCSFAAHSCPKCGEGFLVQRMGKYGSFYGCSSFPLCDYKLK